MRWLTPAALVLWTLSVQAADKPRMIVLEFGVAGGVGKDLALSLAEAVTQEVEQRGFFAPLTTKDVQTLLGMERQRQLAGCTDESTSCLTELAGALGARFILSGTVSRLGDAYQLSLQTLDSQKAQPLGRSVRLARDVEALTQQLGNAVAEATATPLPPPPSRVLPYALLGSGATLVVAGAVLGMDGLSRERAVSRELALGEQGRAQLKPSFEYADEGRLISSEKTLGLLGLLTGAAALGAGLYLNTTSGPGGTQVALLPLGAGAALAGAF